MERREGEEGRGKRRGEGRGGGGRGGSIVEEEREYTQMCMCVYACVCVCVCVERGWVHVTVPNQQLIEPQRVHEQQMCMCVCGAWMGACNSTQSTTD